MVDLTFEKALKETEEAYLKLQIDKSLRDEEAKLGLVRGLILLNDFLSVYF